MINYCNEAIEKATLLRAVYPFPGVQGRLRTRPGLGVRKESVCMGQWLLSAQSWAGPAGPGLCHSCSEWLCQAQQAGVWEVLNIWHVQWWLCLGSGGDYSGREPRARKAQGRSRAAVACVGTVWPWCSASNCLLTNENAGLLCWGGLLDKTVCNF